MKQSQIDSHTSPHAKLFYGYIVVAASFFILIVYSGARSAFGIFFEPMASQFHWSSAALSSVFSISIVMDGLTGIFVGILADRVGPRIVLTFAALLMGAGFFLSSHVNSLWQMYLIYGFLAGIGMGSCFVPVITTIARWFVARRAMMNGIVLSGMGIGTLVVSPVATWLIMRYEWRTSFVVLSVAILVLMLISAQFMRRDPYQMNQKPFGVENPIIQDAPAGSRSFTLKEAIRTSPFWLVFGIFACFGCVTLSLSVHIVPQVIHLNLSPSIGAVVLAITGVASIFGRLFLGAVADKVGNRRVYLLGFFITTICVFWLINIKEIWAFYLFSVIFGFGQGGLSSSQAPIVAEMFGLKSHGLIFGSVGFGAMVGGSIGPYIIGYIFDITGGYTWAFLTLALISLAGTILTLILTRVGKTGSREDRALA
jgi:MFS family permease